MKLGKPHGTLGKLEEHWGSDHTQGWGTLGDIGGH